ncbi:MAG: hypothetical protein QOF76_974 [Solirubrobacteraceae bacterium]|jgi:catechol 2,3-dioxygenase-like lactoylglutathione lyase family enzyme|nr:hypothetical protein [Solirubrobacteraceae bacterium]
MASVSVRYIVDDVDAAIAFYCDHLGFDEVMHPAPTFAMLARGELRLILSAPMNGSAAGGWNRFQLQVEDLEGTVARLREAGVAFRNEIVSGVGVKQILAEDPAGNPVELYEPLLDEARLG